MSYARADDEPRKIDFARVLTGPDGPFRECKHASEDGKCIEYADLTLGRMCMTAAAMPDKGVLAPEQIAHGRLAMKLLETISQPGAKEIAISVDDVKFLKDQIAKLGYNTMAVYQATRLLDPTVDK